MGANGNGSRAAKLAAQLKAQSERALEKEWTAEVKLPIPSIAPDFVFEFVAQRVDLESLLYAGQLPESFANVLLSSKKRKERSPDEAAAEWTERSEADKLAELTFMRDIAVKVCREPRLVFHEPEDDGEFDLRSVPFSGDIILALFQYAMGLSPDVPIALTNGGETTVKAVETFPAGEPGPQLPNGGAAVPEFTGAAV